MENQYMEKCSQITIRRTQEKEKYICIYTHYKILIAVVFLKTAKSTINHDTLSTYIPFLKFSKLVRPVLLRET